MEKEKGKKENFSIGKAAKTGEEGREERREGDRDRVIERGWW